MDAHARVEFTLPARAENVALVRHALSGLAEVLGMQPEEIADLKTVVTEACTNVVTHAYGEDAPGPLLVSARPDDGCMLVTVRDFGRGIRPLADVERRSLRLGLPLIAALTAGFEIKAGPDGGTIVNMRMPFSSNGAAEPAEIEAIEETRIAIDAGEALGPVLSRVISMFATRANFSVDRLSDAVLLSDALSAGDPEHFPDGRASLAIVEEDGAFEVRVGPLREGGARELLEVMRIPEIGASLEALAEEVRVDPTDEGEHLFLRISATG